MSATSDLPDAAPVREVSLDEALAHAVALHRSGEMEAAEALYGCILDAAPDHADALHFYGLLKHQAGLREDAIRLIRRAVELAPANAGMRSNLGNVQMETQRYDQALKAYDHALALDPTSEPIARNRAAVITAIDRAIAREAVLRETLAADPADRDAWEELGNSLATRGLVRDGIAAEVRALELDADTKAVRTRRIAGYLALQDRARSEALLRRLIEEEPNDPTWPHFLAAVSEGATPARASDGFVEATFDGFAASFDRKLAFLEYRAPALVGEALRAAFGEPARSLDILDAGCGTGLCAPFLAPYSRALVGIDLSGGMLDKARERGGYDRLEKAELTQLLRDSPAAYDAIACADTLCYFGPLGPVLCAAHGALRPGGLFVFTVEAAPPETPFQLHLHGRYSHAPAYVSKELVGAGFGDAVFAEADLRFENGEPVRGLVCTAIRR